MFKKVVEKEQKDRIRKTKLMTEVDENGGVWHTVDDVDSHLQIRNVALN